MPPLPIEDKGGVLVVKLADNAARNEVYAVGLRQALYSALASRTAPLVAVDLSSVDFITSSGIALLIGTKRRADLAQGRLVLFGLHHEILELFGLMKLTTLFEIAPDEAAAMACLTPPTAP